MKLPRFFGRIWADFKLSSFEIPYLIYISVACAVGRSVTMSSTDFSFENLVFLEFI